MRKQTLNSFLLLCIGFLFMGKIFTNKNPQKIFINKNPKIVKREINTKVENGIIKYKEKIFYSKKNFSAISKDQRKFKTELRKKLKQDLIGVSFENFKFSLDSAENSATLTCDIKGAMYSSKSYNMHFLVGNWPFDLMNFKRFFKKKLVYKGKINGIPTLIVFEFPYVIANCHEHVWPKS